MSHKLPVVFGGDRVKFLVAGFYSMPADLQPHHSAKRVACFSVPLHGELKKGTQIAILKQAGITVDNFKRLFS